MKTKRNTKEGLQKQQSNYQTSIIHNTLQNSNCMGNGNWEMEIRKKKKKHPLEKDDIDDPKLRMANII